MNKKTKALSSILPRFTLALTGCAGTKAEENHSKQKKLLPIKYRQQLQLE